jgi:hypothetical protein
MKNVKKYSLALLTAVVTFILSSCELTPEMTEVQPTRSTQQVTGAVGIAGLPSLSFPISMDRVKLYFTRSSSLTGTLTIRITNANGSIVLGSTTVLGNSIINDSWNTFYFSAMTLSSGEKYRIEVIRSNPHNYLNDHIAWRSSNGNVYTKGASNFSSNDMTFITYSDGYVDQQQLVNNYGWAIGNSFAVWQEFVPSKIWVVQP